MPSLFLCTSVDTFHLAHPPTFSLAGVFALGDCAISLSRPLPCLAQVAQQQAKYLASVFNKYNEPSANPDAPSFQYKHLGSMAQLGT